MAIDAQPDNSSLRGIKRTFVHAEREDDWLTTRGGDDDD